MFIQNHKRDSDRLGLIPKAVILLLLFFSLFSCKKEKNGGIVTINVDSVYINGAPVPAGAQLTDVNSRNVSIRIKFSTAIDPQKFNKNRIFFSASVDTAYSAQFPGSREILIKPRTNLNPLSSYVLYIDPGENFGGMIKESYTIQFSTQLDSTPKFQVIPDDQLLTLVQSQTFKYFWDYGHPESGLIRERLGSGNTVTSGGSGFGLMAIISGIERGFITRQQGVERLQKIVNFLIRPSTDKFHGAFPHWLNGSTGKVIAFSQKDNGGDLVETSYLMQGLLTLREYMSTTNQVESAVRDTIDKLWRNVEWDWYRKNNENRLYWHWSPDYGWEMNMPVTGWNEALITYVLAASSPTHSIPKEAYDNGWARNGAIMNGKTFYGIRLPLGEDRGGPLFFAHYSFLGLDPRTLSDQYANYWEQNVAHARINYEYCKANPRGYKGYSADCWGLTASDIANGYTASSPNNDQGYIAPTAALSSMPYTPEESMRAMRFFYYVLGDRLWGEYGFKDAFSLSRNWFAQSYLAIDQGPIVVMIENYRTRLLWNLFMKNADVGNGLNKLGFSR